MARINFICLSYEPFRKNIPRGIPIIVEIISKDNEAYTYLPVSVDYFPPRREFARWIEDVDFSLVNFWRLFNGIAVIYKGVKK